MGVEPPGPGSLTFHRKLSCDHVAGTSLSSVAPLPLAPRKAGQSEAIKAPTLTESETTAEARKRVAAFTGSPFHGQECRPGAGRRAAQKDQLLAQFQNRRS